MTDAGTTPPGCFDTDPIARLRDMFLDGVHAQRAVFRKLHGVAHGWFEPLPDLDPRFRHGIFAAGRLPAWIRFSSDAAPTDPDAGTTVGAGIKLFGIPGPKALGDDGDTADLILQNFPVFFVDNVEEMAAFTYAGVVQRNYPAYLAHHPKTNDLLNQMAAKQETSVLTTVYWGILPFRLGDLAVKYRLDPATPTVNVPDDAPDYLATDLVNRLSREDYTFTLSVQVRTDPAKMPLDAATVPWPDDVSPYLPVAKLTLPSQNVMTLGQSDWGQQLAFNIWRTPAENAPVPESSIAAARKVVYAAGADLRHTGQGQPLADPTTPRATTAPVPEPDDCIVHAVVYPSIGIARVGNSPDEWFLGPEVPDPPPMPAGSHRDAEGRLKRQGARFRLYGVNTRGEIVRELTGDPAATISWHVELANTKAAWYGFQLALDIPEASSAPPTTLRNVAIADRAALAITPGPREVSGRSAAPQRFDTGTFMGTPVYLGEAFTDDAQRLVVLGGHGLSTSYDGRRAVTFANNEGWHDDVSDGPVTASVTLDGQELDVTPAWVVVAPPNYGPGRKSVRTMWDLMRDVAINAGTLPRPWRPSFTHDILPLFQRLNGLQWVNAGYAAGFGWQGAFDLTSPEALATLSSTDPSAREKRRVVANAFRDFDIDGMSPKPLPWQYGDAMNIPPVDTPRQNAALTATQLGMLRQWAAGDFVADYDPEYAPPAAIDDVPLARQGDTLTRAALEWCLADAFHPGCEMTWPVRTSTMYMAPFRFLHALTRQDLPPLGVVLTSDNVSLTEGPQQPGSITRWMAVPWQTDTASCLSGYTSTYDPYLPTFWPARVPNQVLTAENYSIVMDAKVPMEARRRAFANRAAWIEPLGSGTYTQQINNMVRGFDHLGVVEARPGPTDTDAFPAIIEVEDQHRDIEPSGDEASAARHRARHPRHAAGSHHGTLPGAGRSAADVDRSDIEKVNRFPGGLRR